MWRDPVFGPRALSSPWRLAHVCTCHGAVDASLSLVQMFPDFAPFQQMKRGGRRLEVFIAVRSQRRSIGVERGRNTVWCLEQAARYLHGRSH